MKGLEWRDILTFMKILSVLNLLWEKKYIHEHDAAINLVFPLKHFFL